jgi:hypothetical protein
MSDFPLIPIGEIKESLSVVAEDKPQFDRPVSIELPISVSGVAQPLVSPGDQTTWLGGVYKRTGTKTPRMNRKMKRGFKSFVHRWCKTNLTPLDPGYDLSPETWLENAPYSRKRKTKLMSDFRKFQTGTLGVKETAVKGFQKWETYPSIKYPRMINSRSDYFKVYSGPAFDAISKEIFSNKYFIKKIPVDLRPKALYEELYSEGSTYIATDYTSFEAHFTSEVMACCEFIMYRYMMKNHTEGKKTMNEIIRTLQGKNKIIYRHGVVEIDASRMSGEMNTSLGNGFTNLMVFLYLSERNGAGQVKGFVEGDDGLFSVQNPSKAPTAEDFFDLGWNIKIDTHKNLNHASFCGCVFEITDMVNVPDVLSVLTTLGWGSQRYVNASQSTQMMLLKSKALSYAYQYNGVPIVSKLSRSILKTLEHVKIEGRIVKQLEPHKQVILSRAMKNLPPERVVGNMTRNLVWELQNIPISDQIKIESALENTALPINTRVEFPTLDFPPLWSHIHQNYVVRAGQKPKNYMNVPSRNYLELLQNAHPKAINQFTMSTYLVSV